MVRESVLGLKKKIRALEKLAKAQEAEIHKLSSISERDPLTELYNRRGFIREAEKFLGEVRATALIKEKRKIYFEDFSVVFIDVDKLKSINDEFGHKTGDRTLKMMGKLLQNSVRDLDVVARWGGDEFVIGLAGADEKKASEISEKLRKKLRFIKIHNRNLTASFGIVSYHHKNKISQFSPEFSKRYKNKEKILSQLYELIEKADMTMYEAKKKKGKGSVVVYDKHNI